MNRRIRPGTLEMKAFQPTFCQHLGVLDSTKQYSCATLPMPASHGPEYDYSSQRTRVTKGGSSARQPLVGQHRREHTQG